MTLVNRCKTTTIASTTAQSDKDGNLQFKQRIRELELLNSGLQRTILKFESQELPITGSDGNARITEEAAGGAVAEAKLE